MVLQSMAAQISIDGILKLVNFILMTIGLYQIFPKFGVESKWAYVPFVRIYKLAQCADRELSGRLYIVFQILYYILDLARCVLFILAEQNLIAETNAAVYAILLIVVFEVGTVVCDTVYQLRIYGGLCHQFRKKKIWTVVFLFVSSIPLILWGYDRKLEPRRRLDHKKEAAGISGITAEAVDEGLTVNIESRTAIEVFKKKYLLRDIHMTIKPGRMVLLLGGSGAGKTTFVNAVTGYEKAKAEILLNGDDVYSEYEKMKYEIGLVPQMDLMRYEDTVEHTLMDSAKLRLPVGVSRKEMKDRVNHVLDIFGLAPVRDNMVVKLSGGQKKRLSIGTEFICDPNLFILDEPDSGLDGVMARELMTRLHEISREGKIVIVITHTPDRVLDLFDDVIVLAKDANRTGRLAFYGTIDDAKKFFGKDNMEEVVKAVNRKEEGGEGMADEFIAKFGEAANGKATA